MAAVQSGQAAVAGLRRAAAALASARRLTPAQQEGIYGLAYSLFQRGHYAQAADYFAYLGVYQPLAPRPLKGLAAAQLMARQWPQAIASYALLVCLCPHDGEVLCLYGQALLHGGAEAEARAALALAAQSGGAWGARAAGLLALLTAD